MRYPTSVGRLLQEVVAKEVASPSVVINYEGGGANTDLSDSKFTVSDAGIFWVQPVADVNRGQYIFHSPLPPQPCDGELPCANTADVCTNGFCVAS